MANLYKPPTKVTTKEYTWLSVVTMVDPNWGRDRHYEIQYEMTRRVWFCNTDVDGPYSPFSRLWQQGLPNGGGAGPVPPVSDDSWSSGFSSGFGG